MDPSRPLEGRVALVTGASKGIGQALAVGLAANGSHVAVNYKTDAEGAAKTVATAADHGVESRAYAADVSSIDEVNAMVDDTVRDFGALDILVNNAGRTRFGPASEVTPEDWDDVMNTNLRGAFFMSVAAERAMEAGGSIINISSCAATLMVRDHAVYTASKGGVEAMTRQLALEFAPKVRVNAISPAATSMERNWGYSGEFDGSWASVTPMKRVASPADYVAPLVFLGSAASGFLTGEILHVDGGWTLKGHYPDMDDYDYSADRDRG